jgi:hypothetical protein
MVLIATRAGRCGPGFVTASVVDPFGNVLGVMYNRHYLGVLEAIRSG